MPSESNEPIALQYSRAGNQWAEAEAAASLLEDLKSSVLSERIADLVADDPKMAINRAEAAVKASQEWKQYIHQMVDARKQANRLKVQMEVLRMRFAQWQSEQANQRIEARL